MPLRNRVTPFGEIVALPARGTFMGNRGGAIHDDKRNIVRQYASRRWICCLLEFRGHRRIVMSPDRYTELFFLDEAVALAAGHRPCAECRRERFTAFRESWALSVGVQPGTFLYADALDLELHRARIDRAKKKVTWSSSLDSLPSGCFVEIGGSAYLVLGGELLQWSPNGYVEKHRRSDDPDVSVLTPEPIVRCLRHGYRPELHYSALTL